MVKTGGMILRRLRRFGRDERGAPLIEYVMAMALVAMVASGALAAIGVSVGDALQTVADAWP